MGMPVSRRRVVTQLPGKLLIPDRKPYVPDRLGNGPWMTTLLWEIKHKNRKEESKGTKGNLCLLILLCDFCA
jgi:hypothetical protein